MDWDDDAEIDELMSKMRALEAENKARREEYARLQMHLILPPSDESSAYKTAENTLTPVGSGSLAGHPLETKLAGSLEDPVCEAWASSTNGSPDPQNLSNSFDFDFNFNQGVLRSPLSVAFDTGSIRSCSTDPDYGDIGSLRARAVRNEKGYRAPVPQTSYDPILPRERTEDLIDLSLVHWKGQCDPENPLYWPLGRKLCISIIVSLLTFAVSLASSIFSEDVHITALEFDASEKITVLGVSLYVLGFACGESKSCPSVIR